jgi:O-antigen biosynthesis protein
MADGKQKEVGVSQHGWFIEGFKYYVAEELLAMSPVTGALWARRKRERTWMMTRIKNEARWIARNLERTFQVAGTVVIFDDGSTDDTEQICERFLDHKELRDYGWYGRAPRWGRHIHFLRSPYAHEATPRVDEVRDKNYLWAFLKERRTAFDYVLCLDGDEMLSRQLIHDWPLILRRMQTGVDVVVLPFIYLWDGEERQRNDGIYGPGADGYKRIRHARLFTTLRLEPLASSFVSQGHGGGFHCGSVPTGQQPMRDPALWPAPIVHFGYLEDDLRQSKYHFYTSVDPNNQQEGGYRHVIGQPNQLAPGAVEIVPWEDSVQKRSRIGHLWTELVCKLPSMAWRLARALSRSVTSHKSTPAT